ncbi:LapA family protein [Thermodesulfobacteriota bacterium]
MRKIKSFLLLIIIVFLAFIGIQNKDLFLDPQNFRLNFYFIEEYIAPELPNAVFLFAFLLSGLLVSYFFSLWQHFKSRKTIKSLTATIEYHLQEISQLRNEVESIKGDIPDNEQETSDSPAEEAQTT